MNAFKTEDRAYTILLQSCPALAHQAALSKMHEAHSYATAESTPWDERPFWRNRHNTWVARVVEAYDKAQGE